MNFAAYYAKQQGITADEAESWIAFLRAVRNDVNQETSGLATWCRRQFCRRTDMAAEHAAIDAPKFLRDVGRAQMIHELPALLAFEIDTLESLYTAWQEEMTPIG